MSKIEEIIDKLASIATLELTQKEIYLLSQSKHSSEILKKLDKCKLQNKGNTSSLNSYLISFNNYNYTMSILFNKDINNTYANDLKELISQQHQFDFSQYFICCCSSLCEKQLQEFKNCQSHNKNHVSQCKRELNNLTTCLETRIDNFSNNLLDIKDI